MSAPKITGVISPLHKLSSHVAKHIITLIWESPSHFIALMGYKLELRLPERHFTDLAIPFNAPRTRQDALGWPLGSTGTPEYGRIVLRAPEGDFCQTPCGGQVEICITCLHFSAILN